MSQRLLPIGLRRTALVGVSAALLLVAGAAVPAGADSSGGSSRAAVSRSGGSSSGSSSGSGVSSRSSGSSTRSSGSVRSRGSSGAGSSRSSGRAVVTRPSLGRSRSGGSWSHGHHGHYYGSHYGFSLGFFGYWPYWGWGYPYYGPPYGYYPPVVYASSPGYGMGALDLNVRPKQTEVYVNGQYVGLVKQYDGFPGYLWLESGVYEVAFYRPGFRTVTREFEIFTGMVLDVSIEMTPGEAVQPTRPEVAQAPPRPQPAPQPGTVYERPQEPTPAPPAGQSSRVDLTIEPAEASVYLDGRFVGTGRELAGGLPVGSGEHVVEVVLPGYEQETVRFEVRPGLDAAVDVRLEPLDSAGG